MFVEFLQLMCMTTLRDKFSQTKALEDMSRNAEIIDITIDLSFYFTWTGEKRTTFARAFHEVSGTEKLERKFAEDLCGISNEGYLTDVEWLEEKQKQKYDTLACMLKKVKGAVHLNPIVYIKYRYFDGETRLNKMNYKITENSHYLPFLEPCVSEVYVEPKTENPPLKIGDTVFTMNQAERFPDTTSQEEFLTTDYLKTGTPWMVADFGSINEKDDGRVTLPIHSENATVPIEFSKPYDTSSDIWELASHFEYNNPYNLQNERLQLAPVSIVKNVPYKHTFWSIRKDKNNNPNKIQNNGIWGHLKSLTASLKFN